ncbi:MAG TPA: hypothetical protein VNT20_02510 [Flavisolibacter sp.]|nr:hypothetical protein [Flavisolibacter sp.]
MGEWSISRLSFSSLLRVIILRQSARHGWQRITGGQTILNHKNQLSPDIHLPGRNGIELLKYFSWSQALLKEDISGAGEY